MATNTADSSTEHTGNGSTTSFSISFTYLSTAEIDVKVNNVVKSIGSDYTISGQTLEFSSAPTDGHVISIKRDTNIGQKKVDFEDGSVLTETDLDNNTNQLLFGIQEIADDYVKRDGTQTITGDIVFEGSADDANETTLSITNPTADRTITVPDRSGTIITSGDTGTVTNTILAGNSVDSSKIIDGSIVNADVNASAAIAQSKLNIANATTSAAGYQSAADKTKLDGIESNATQDQTASEIRTLIASDPLTATHLAANSVDSSELVDGSVDHSHLSNDCVDGDNVQDDSINSEHIAAGSLDNEHYAAGSITSDKLNGATVITSSEQGSATTNDTSFLTSAAADARFFNISSGDTIKNGQTFPDNDTTIATTAAINDRIIDLIDDVGGFTIIASEQAFPDVNPQGVTGQAAVLSIKAATTNLVPSGTTVTVVNGNVADNADITITGVPSTIPSGFGFLVESTSTLHEYAFHRLVPKATEVTTVAGKAVEIGRLGTADAVADMAILGTTDVVADMNTLATADIVSDMNTLATTDVVNDMNTLAVTSVINNMDTVATNVTNVNNVGNNITNVNNLTNSTGANQTFTVTVQNVSGNKYFIDGVQTPVLKLARGKTYTFNLADSSNSGHPLAFRDSSDNSYTTGVTTSGTAGSSGATVVIVVAANAPSSLKYYCTSHGNAMGNTINVIDDNVGAVAGALTNVNFVGGSITNVNNVGNSISNVNTVASNISSVNSFFNLYRIGSSNPTSSLDTGDLFFNTSTNSLKVYTGSAWVDGVTTTGDFALKTGNTFTGSNIYNDNQKAIFGTGSDGLEIFHDGSNSLIKDTGTGNLTISTNQLLVRNAAVNEYQIQAVENAGVKLYWDNSKKLETTSSGATVTGNLAFGDNGKASFGASGDLQIFHNGSNSLINDLGTGGVIIAASKTNIMNAAAGENMAVFNDNASVELYYDGTKKLETTSSGVTVTGGITSGNITINSSFPTILLTDSDHNNDFSIINGNGTFRITDTTIGLSRFSIAGDGTASFSKNVDCAEGLDVTGNITVTGTVDGVDIAALNTTVSNITTDVVSDTSPQLGGDLQSNGNNITLGDSGGANDDRLVFGAGNDLQIYHDGSNSYLTNDTGVLNIQGGGGNIQLQAVDGESGLIVKPDDAVELYFNGSKKFHTASIGCQVTGNLFLAGGYINLNDNYSYGMGSGNRAQLYHSGSHQYLLNTVGNMYFQPKSGENGIVVKPDGAVELYYDNTKHFETRSDGVIISGRLSTSNTGAFMTLSDSSPYGFIIDQSASRNITIRTDGDNINLNQRTNGEYYIRCIKNTDVKVFYDGSQKLGTTSTGVSITGRATFSQPYAEYYGVNNASGTSGWKTFQWRVQQERRTINHSNSISTFTPQQAGWYLVVLNHYHNNGTHSDYYLRILRNGSISWGYRKFDNAFTGNLSAVMYFNGSSDYFSMATYHSNSSHPDDNSELTNFACIYLTA